MQSFVSAIIEGDVSGISEAADGMLNIFNNYKKEEKWKYILQKCTELGIIFSNQEVPFNSIDDLLVPYNPDSLFLEPWDPTAIPIQFRPRFDSTFPEMAAMNGFTKSWVTIIMFGEIFGFKFFDSPITKFFLRYLELFDEEPFIEFADGKIVLSEYCRDSAVTLRVKLYIRTIWEVMTGKLDNDIAFETFSYLFKNPQVHTMNMKDWKGPLLNCALSTSTSGETCAWNDSNLSSFTLKPMPSINPDFPTYSRLKSEVDKSLKEMKQSGLVKTARKFQTLISGPVDYESASDFSTFWFLEALSGYFRSNFPNTAIASIKDARANKFFRDKNMLKDELFHLWYEFFTHYIEKIPDTQEEFVIELMADLTTRSNGLNKLTFDSSTGDNIPNPDIGSVDIDMPGTFSGSKVKWSFNDKALTFRYLLSNPMELFDYDKMRNTMTYDNPGRFFTRYVPARKVRMVYGVNLFRFLTERYTRSMYDWLASKKFPEATTGKTQYPISTLAIDTGRYLTEMGRYLYYTGNPDLQALILLADFGNFDQTQVHDNFRVHMIAAAKQASIDKHEVLERKRYEILGNRTPMENLIGHWETCNDAVFAVHTGDPNKRVTLLQTGWLYSGENGTLVINTTTNLAYVNVVRSKLGDITVKLSVGDRTLADFFSFESFKLQGDDQIAVIQKLILGLSIQDQTLLYSALLKLLGDVAESCGIDISINKTGLRSGHFEFLKKAGIWGYAIPRYMQISLEEQETINRTNDPIERFRSRLGQEREFIFRGGNTLFGLIRLYCEWNLTRSVHFGKNSNNELVSFNLPFTLIWTPVSKGGVGMHPVVNTDPNVDIMLAMYDWPVEIRNKININIDAINSAPKKDNSFIVNQVKPVLEAGMKIQREMDHKANSVLILESKAAYDRLKGRGMPADNNAFFLRYDQEILEAIEDNPKISQINVEWKQNRAKAIIVYCKTHSDPMVDHLSLMGIPGIRFESIEIIDNHQLPINPIAGLDPFLSEWLRQIGTSSESKVVTGDEFAKLTRLINKGSFPRNLKANNIESIASSLLRLGFTDQISIADFLIMRGADTASALEVGTLLSKKMDMLRYLSSVSAFSFVGEGFSDKSKERIDELVQYLDPVIDNGHPYSQIIKSLAYQFIRVQPLWNKINGKLHINKRRRVLIHLTNLTLAEYLIKGVTQQIEGEDLIREQMVRDSIYLDQRTNYSVH